jgi:hypothetical protein
MARRQRQQRRRSAAKERHWRRMLGQWRQSGLSVRDFCDWRALSEPSFYSWRRELTQRDRETAAAGSRAAANSASRTTEQNGAASKRTPTFLPVQILSDGAPPSPVGPPVANRIEVHLPSGVRLHVPAGCDRQTLVDVLAAVSVLGETRPC